MRLSPVAALAALTALACSSTVGGVGQTCNDFCGHVANLSCGQGCLPACAQAQQACEQQGQGSAFRSLLGCYAGASFACQGGALATNDCSVESDAVSSCAARSNALPPPTDASPFGVDASGGADASTQDGALADTATSGEGGDADAGEAVCAAKSTRPDCILCCENLHIVGLLAYDNALSSCACFTPGACKQQCSSSYCANMDPADGDPCDLCLRQAVMSGGACYEQVIVQACDPQADCAALLACVQNDGCDAKP